MSCNWCKSGNGVYTDENGDKWPCIECNPVKVPMKAQKIKGGNCAIVAVLLLGGAVATVAGLVEVIRHIV